MSFYNGRLNENGCVALFIGTDSAHCDAVRMLGSSVLPFALHNVV